MERMKRTVTGYAALFLAVLLVSCAQVSGSARSTGSGFDFGGTEWKLYALNGQPLIEGTNITLNFGDGTFGFDRGTFNGYSGCNWHGGDYTATETTIDFISGPSTAVGCDAPILQQEDAYWRAQSQAVRYRVSGDRLELANGAGKVTLAFVQEEQLSMNPADLVGTQWQLRAVSGEAIPADAQVTLNFPTTGIFNDILGCVDYSGKYIAEGDDMRFIEYGHTYARCDEGGELQDPEAHYSISGATDYLPAEQNRT